MGLSKRQLLGHLAIQIRNSILNTLYLGSLSSKAIRTEDLCAVRVGLLNSFKISSCNLILARLNEKLTTIQMPAVRCTVKMTVEYSTLKICGIRVELNPPRIV